MNKPPKTWIVLDENNALRWYRIVDFKLDDLNNVQILLACTGNVKDDTLTMVMRHKYPDGSKKGAYAYPTDMLMCVDKADQFIQGVREGGYEIIKDSGNVYLPDGMDVAEYIQDSVHFDVINSASKEETAPKELTDDGED